ncbi:hypothetical protein [Prochlorococcus sp. MIT 1303]|uniref:hypothetical protein n=1 Tax=Prochlorococcus sp. MIT 1303 TaxID=1723647 RepID=UPI0007B31B64|nr:hypothetical protein [Prochlorococcus sp. MIT 1303]KZR61988.1 hypothetical protein PMIT1303_02191 [Prochlorococcus sp. MIT 1303]
MRHGSAGCQIPQADMTLAGTSIELMMRWAKLMQRSWQSQHVQSGPFRYGSIGWAEHTGRTRLRAKGTSREKLFKNQIWKLEL